MGAMIASLYHALAIWRAENPCRHAVHQDGNRQRHTREHCHLALVAAHQPHQVKHVDDQVARDNWIISHASGLTKFNPTNMRHTRATPPRSMSTNAPAQQMHTMDVMTAGTDMRLNDSMPNTCAELAHNQTASRQADEVTLTP